MDLGNLLSTGLTVATVGSLAGVGLMKGTLTNLRARLDDYEKEVEEKDRRHAEDRTKLAQTVTDLSALQRIVTGEAHWVKLGQVLDEHHEQAKEHWTKDEDLLGEVLAELRLGKGKP